MGKPKIRFKGYTEDWEQRKLGEYVEITSGEAPAKFQEGDINYVKVDDLNYAYKTVVNTQNKVLKNSSVKMVQAGSVIFPKRGAAILTNKVRILGVDSYMDTNMMALSSEKLETNFLYTMLSKEGLYKIADTSTIPQINNKHIEPYKIYVPKMEEQHKIGTYFSNLDHLITLHHRKPYVLVEIKIFVWEQRKVSELLQERNEQAPMSEEYPLMAFIANQGVAPKGDRYDRSALVNDETGKKYKRTEFGDFIYSSNNLETGSIGLNKYGNACISPVYSIFKQTGRADLDFLGRRFLRKDFINEMVKWRQGVVYGQWKIHETDFLNIAVTVPSIEEQKRIGDLLDGLDCLITLHQRKCDELKNMKKYMLQNMFV